MNKYERQFQILARRFFASRFTLNAPCSRRCRQGFYLPAILITSVLFVTLASALTGIAISDIKRATVHERLVSGLNIAETGINYYMWHLSHDNKDFCDGKNCFGEPPYGPFFHDYTNSTGQIIGSYSLYITPSINGDSSVRVKSVGKIKNSNTESTVVADVGMTSFAYYSFISNTECWFGQNETTNGPVHSNVGVHFDGTSNGVVSASSKTYKASANFAGDNQYHDGVWGNGGPKGFWVYPVPAVDFDRISIDFNKLQTEAQSGRNTKGSCS
jgi:hypothetical protein